MSNLDSLLQHVPVSASAQASVLAGLRAPTRHYHDLNHVLEM